MLPHKRMPMEHLQTSSSTPLLAAIEPPKWDVKNCRPDHNRSTCKSCGVCNAWALRQPVDPCRSSASTLARNQTNSLAEYGYKLFPDEHKLCGVVPVPIGPEQGFQPKSTDRAPLTEKMRGIRG